MNINRFSFRGWRVAYLSLLFFLSLLFYLKPLIFKVNISPQPLISSISLTNSRGSMLSSDELVNAINSGLQGEYPTFSNFFGSFSSGKPLYLISNIFQGGFAFLSSLSPSLSFTALISFIFGSAVLTGFFMKSFFS